MLKIKDLKPGGVYMDRLSGQHIKVTLRYGSPTKPRALGHRWNAVEGIDQVVDIHDGQLKQLPASTR